MDVAYDHIQEESLASSGNPHDSDSPGEPSSSSGQRQDLTSEFQDSLRLLSAQPWGARLGGLWSNVRKQSETYYEGARQEYNAASEEAIRGFTGLRASLIDRTRGLSISGLSATNEAEEAVGDREDVDADGEGFISRFRSEAAKRLKDLEKAEDAADEALLKFGTNIRNFLREAVSIAPPNSTGEKTDGKVLFESRDSDGKRVIHTTRFEAQLHAIHSSLEGFSEDPASKEWDVFKDNFEVDKKTESIAADLEKYPELRKAMESLVPEKVEYGDFWRRYYFLRLVIETEEKRRKDLLKASTDEDEEVAWDEDSDSDSPATPQAASPSKPSSNTLSKEHLQAEEPRRSNDLQSQAGSDASYDLVSGATSHSASSPKENQSGTPAKDDDSDEEDWE
ncbi:BSD domain-containing protein [Trichophyton tonsurans CBS 112818]|uniref:BSD domain-containing protein n=1 Tax=Trichophyton tonsurans (strain CBS 112818) TaxID=647933 RepID=F2S5T5_TRIT1|nr:BSD domain-containing protein [Trichophyton tonsurans CBS 112818]